MTYVPIITAIELAIVDRLTRGLGRMVDEVKTYGGEFDDETFDTVVRRFPAAWVTFGGVRRTEPHSTSKNQWRAEATFVVMLGARSLRSEEATRHGGAAKAEVGTNLLVSAVRLLLNQQDLGLPVRELQPGAIRTLFNTRTHDEAISVFALEFHTAWVEDTLFLGAFPHGSVEDSLAGVFEAYGGQIDPAPTDWRTTLLRYYLEHARPHAADAKDRIERKEKS